MKLFFFFAFLAVLATTVIAWEKEDHEIFDLVSDVEASEGKGTTFYSWLDVPPTASTSEIAKAYRKMSMQLHPDKNPNAKGIHERFARLGVVATILRNKTSRKRYDFFYKNGVPKWRGTGYYYQRFRPGLGSVAVFLTILTSGLQLLVQRMNYTRDLERIERFTRDARAAAWGPKLVPNEGQRKVKVNVGGGMQEEGGSGKWIDMVVEGQDVYILDPTGDMHLLDASSAPRPAISNTWFISLIKSLISKVIKPKNSTASDDATDQTIDEDELSSMSSSDAPGSGASTPRENGNGISKAARVPTTMAGGKRRKATKKR